MNAEDSVVGFVVYYNGYGFVRMGVAAGRVTTSWEETPDRATIFPDYSDAVDCMEMTVGVTAMASVIAVESCTVTLAL
jgi:hypothetical protein